MDYKKIREQIRDSEGDADALFDTALNLLVGHQEQDKAIRRLIEISRPAVGAEEEWSHTVQALTQ